MRMCIRLLITLALGLLLAACCKTPPPTLSEAQRNRARQLAVYSVAWHQEHPASASASHRPVRMASAERPQLAGWLTPTEPSDEEEGISCHQ